METYSALRVFWKSRKWNLEKPISDSDEDISRRIRRKHVRKQKSVPLRDTEDLDEQQVCDQVVTFPCSICKEEIDTSGIFVHKRLHLAMATLGFQWMRRKKPQPSKIAVQREIMISKLFSSSFLFTEKILQSINNAFELLWKKQVPAYYKIFDAIDSSSIYSQKCCHLLIKGVATCGDRNSAWRAHMNDTFTIMNDFGNKPNVCFFGLFDGHHGISAADLASKELPVLLLHQLSKLDPSYQMTSEQQQQINSFHTVFRQEYTATEDLFSSTYKTTRIYRHEYEDIHKAFAKAFWRMDRLLRLGRKEVSRVQWSGCSAVTCILEGSIKNPHVNNWGRNNKCDAESCPFQMMPQIISGVLHIANAGNVQAVLCRNGKGFCLTKEHTTRNINERRRVLQNGAVISSNKPYGLLEGRVKTTRGLGFHGNLKLKKFIIPAPHTISVPIDDLCQFLILATNGLWEVLDKQEVTALVITMFQMYKETYASIIQNKSPPSKEPLLLSINDTSITKSESNTHILCQYKPESKESLSTTNLKENSTDSKYSEYGLYNPKNAETFPPEMTNHESFNEKETDRPISVDGENTSEKESCKSFFESAAEYVSRELVNAALEAGSRDNIMVTVIFLSGSEYQLLT